MSAQPKTPCIFEPGFPSRHYRHARIIAQAAASEAGVSLLLADLVRGEQAERALVCRPVPAWARPAMEACQ